MSVKIQKNQRNFFFSCLELLAIDLKERIEVGSILDLNQLFRCIYAPYKLDIVCMEVSQCRYLDITVLAKKPFQ